VEGLAVDLQQAKMHLMNVEGVQLVGPVLHHPFFGRSGIDGNHRLIAHGVGFEHRAQLALEDIEVDLIVGTRPRVFREGDDALLIGAPG